MHDLRTLAPALLALLVGCTGDIEGPPGGSNPPLPDAGSTLPEGCTEREAALQARAGELLEARCTNPACHMPVGPRAPSFAAADLAALVEGGMVVPSAPRESRVYLRMDPDDPRFIMPPTLDHHDPADLAAVREWIEAGAPTRCASAPPAPAPHPNSLPQDALFTCSDPSAPRSSPARLRRLEQTEWIHAVGGVLSRTVYLTNPFVAPAGAPSTFAGDGNITANTLGLYLDVLDRALADLPPWYRRQGATEPTCITRPEEGTPDDACRDAFVTEMLERAVLFRAPSATERADVRAFLDAELAAELAAERTDDPTAARTSSLQRVFAAAWLMTGALFRSELGELETDDGRRRLSDAEAARALAAALSTYPPTTLRSFSYAPRPELGWVQAYRAAQAEGALDDPDAIRAFVTRVLDLDAGYVGGVYEVGNTPGRADLGRDYGGESSRDNQRRIRRGEHWLAPRIARFFREYFDYDETSTVFKDTPAATSWWERSSPTVFAAVSRGYTIIQSGDQNYGEPLLAEQLDDTIARLIIDAERSGEDVFRALLTGRRWRVAGTYYGAVSIGPECDVNVCNERVRPEGCCTWGDCMAVRVRDDGSIEGHCGGGTFNRDGDFYSHSMLQVSRVYGLAEPIHETTSTVRTDPALAARWVSVSEAERAGVLTHPAWLSAHGGNFENDASAVLRGHWIREHLFCESVGGLDLVQLQAQLRDGTESDRARDRMHATFYGPEADSRCANAACHGAMNSLGMPFEIFNHAGFLRDLDHGHAPDGHATITDWPGRPGAVEVNDALELAHLLADDPHARRCFVRHVFRYFAGRDETPADACTLTEMEDAFASGSFFAMLRALLTSDTFLYREGDAR